MSKFVIACPSCGRYAEARTGFFARKKIDCSCGNVIHVRTDKLTGRECSHCGNMVVFDQSKGENAKCPVCHEPINTMAEQSQTAEFPAPSAASVCGRLRVRNGMSVRSATVKTILPSGWPPKKSSETGWQVLSSMRATTAPLSGNTPSRISTTAPN